MFSIVTSAINTITLGVSFMFILMSCFPCGMEGTLRVVWDTKVCSHPDGKWKSSVLVQLPSTYLRYVTLYFWLFCISVSLSKDIFLAQILLGRCRYFLHEPRPLLAVSHLSHLSLALKTWHVLL